MANLQELLQQAQAIRPTISRVSFNGTLFADGENFARYEAKDSRDEWSGETPEELLNDIKEWS